MQLTVTLIIERILAVLEVILVHSSAFPQAEDWYVHNNGGHDCEHIRDQEKIIVVRHVQYRKLQQVDIIVGRSSDLYRSTRSFGLTDHQLAIFVGFNLYGWSVWWFFYVLLNYIIRGILN